jgi:hypothetical protein
MSVNDVRPNLVGQASQTVYELRISNGDGVPSLGLEEGADALYRPW